MAIEDDYVRKNPFNFQLSEVIEDDCKPKVALSEEQEARLLTFMEQDRTYQKYHDDVLILLKTGLRISELCGLTRSDIDFKNHEKTPLPRTTPHSLRHTFCTQLAQKNMNPKNLQYIMGHASITITLDLYAHASEAGANREMRSLIA